MAVHLGYRRRPECERERTWVRAIAARVSSRNQIQFDDNVILILEKGMLSATQINRSQLTGFAYSFADFAISGIQKIFIRMDLLFESRVLGNLLCYNKKSMVGHFLFIEHTAPMKKKSDQNKYWVNGAS